MSFYIIDTPMKALLIILSALLISPNYNYSQTIEANDSTNIKLKNIAREIIESAGLCTLITLDKDGNPRARAMDPFLPNDDFTIWFGTNAKSRKVEQIKNDPRVTLYYLNRDGSGYVSVYGTAELVNDKKSKDKYWKEEWEAFYHDKEIDYLLIKFTPLWMELISTPHGITGDSINWQPPKVVFNSNNIIH